MTTLSRKARLLLPASLIALGSLGAVTAQASTSLNIGAVPTGTGWFFGISEGDEGGGEQQACLAG